MTTHMYNHDWADVDPVFFAVVPDSFMADRDPRAGTLITPRQGEWRDEIDRPLLSPRDRWSF